MGRKGRVCLEIEDRHELHRRYHEDGATAETLAAAFGISRSTAQIIAGVRQPRGLTLAERYWLKVVRGEGPDDCWAWTARTSGFGYGSIRRGGAKDGSVPAHRLSWEIAHGCEVPAGMNVLHSCDNPPCTNPEHLFTGTQLDNIRDCVAKGRFVSRRPAYGEDNHAAKLTRADVDEMRALYRGGGWTYAQLGARYGVCSMSILRVIKRRTWVAV